MKDLKITIIQSDLVWENPFQNLANFGLKIAVITENPDIIVLPEMFNTAFSINPAKCAETMDDRAPYRRNEASRREHMDYRRGRRNRFR